LRNFLSGDLMSHAPASFAARALGQAKYSFSFNYYEFPLYFRFAGELFADTLPQKM
jgi:hypothetical protein